jgi:hypothetical protein
MPSFFSYYFSQYKPSVPAGVGAELVAVADLFGPLGPAVPVLDAHFFTVTVVTGNLMVTSQFLFGP